MKGYVNDPGSTGERMSADGFFSTGDLAWIDADGHLFLLGRKSELIECADGSYVDPMHLSNLLVRSIFVKDAMVARLGSDDFLSVFVLPDFPRVRKDADYVKRVNAGLAEGDALRTLLEGAVEYARSLANSGMRISSERIYLLDRKLGRTPTHKIKYLFELRRLNLESFV